MPGGSYFPHSDIPCCYLHLFGYSAGEVTKTPIGLRNLQWQKTQMRSICARSAHESSDFSGWDEDTSAAEMSFKNRNAAPPAAVDGHLCIRKCVSSLCYMCPMMSCWWGGLGWLKHCSLSPQRCGFAGVHLFVSAALWYAAHVDNLVHILHSLHLWQRQWAMEKGRGKSVCSRGRSVIWLQRNCASDSCCYTWSDSLLLQLRWPHVQYDFTRSFPVLGNSFFFFHGHLSPASLLTERQVHDLVIPLFPEWLSIPVKIQPDRQEHKVCLSHSRLHRAAGAGVVVITQFTTARQDVVSQLEET